MKSMYVFLLATIFSVHAFAQDDSDGDERKGGFKKENLFTGGSLNLSFGNQQTALGISPYFGYSVNKYLDVAVSAGFNYISQRQYDPYYGNYLGKVRQTVYGPGAFVRIFPVKFLYAQAQYEYNTVRQKYIYASETGLPTQKFKGDASSFLVGAGYAGGRDESNKSYFYLSVMWDVAKSAYSPYTDYRGNAVPIVRVGYNIALFQPRMIQKRRSE